MKRRVGGFVCIKWSKYWWNSLSAKEGHKATWISPDGVTENQINHILLSQQWKTLLQAVRVKRGATIESDHHLVVASLKIKLAA